MNQRDGQGRLLQETATVGGGSAFVETCSWRANSTLNGYSAMRSGTGAWNDNRNYQYNSRNQLTKEPIGLNNTVAATNNYSFDPNKLGVLTNAQWSGGLSNRWQGTLDLLGQINFETWSESNLTLRAGGSAMNASSVSAKLDGGSVGSTLANGRWYSDLTLAPGSHGLTASATYPGSQFISTVTNSFTVVGTNSVIDYYDGAGNLTNRVFANGKTQSLVWDGFGRLVSLVQWDNPTNGFNWTAIYDCLGRRLRTVQTPVINGITNSGLTLTLDSYYDPLVEFQELAVAVNGQRTWKVMGPDLNGRYGGVQGVGGLEATVRETDGLITPVLNDFWGNVLATISGTTMNWSPSRVSGYGPVLGYEAPILSASAPLAETMVWRSRRIDPSGFYYMGARYYDPVAGHFLSPDPLGHAASSDLYSAFNGDPVNYFDANGRCANFENKVNNINLSYDNAYSPSSLSLSGSGYQPIIFSGPGSLQQPYVGNDQLVASPNNFQNFISYNAVNNPYGLYANTFGLQTGSGEYDPYETLSTTMGSLGVASDVAHYSSIGTWAIGSYGTVGVWAEGAGNALTIGGIGLDLVNPNVSWGQFTANTAVSATAWTMGRFGTAMVGGVEWGGPVGAALSGGYFVGGLIQKDANNYVEQSFQDYTDRSYGINGLIPQNSPLNGLNYTPSSPINWHNYTPSIPLNPIMLNNDGGPSSQIQINYNRNDPLNPNP
jgi:RHS repeat-associated protein